MSSYSNSEKQFAGTIGQVISRILIIIGFIALIATSWIVVTVVYKNVPVEILGMKIGYQVEEIQSNDIPFLVTEVQQLKEQRKLLDQRLALLFNENDNQKIEIKACNDKLNLSSKG